MGVTRNYKIDYEGIVNFIAHQYEESPTMGIRRWAAAYMDEKECASCKGTRLKKEALNFKIDNKSVADCTAMDLSLKTWWLLDRKSAQVVRVPTYASLLGAQTRLVDPELKSQTISSEEIQLILSTLEGEEPMLNPRALMGIKEALCVLRVALLNA